MNLLETSAQLATCRAEGGQAEIHADRRTPRWRGRAIGSGGSALGPELPAEFRAARRFDAGGGLVIPGLVDCHTHLAFGGWRAEEFEQRLLGAELPRDRRGRRGHRADDAAHPRGGRRRAGRARSAGFLREMLALGVTTVECKSGYGLDREHELRLLRLYRAPGGNSTRCAWCRPSSARTWCRPSFGTTAAAYLALLIDDLLPIIGRERLAAFCDVFVERSAFTVEEARRLLTAARAAGLGAKLHADQLSAGGGAELAAEVGAVSADHLECASEAGIAAMARAGVVAVSLPLASLYLGQAPAPARRWIEAGAAVAVATDFNPGSAPSYHLPFALTLACTLQRMTPAEALKGATIIAARAVGLEADIGSLEPGKAADFAVIDAPDVTQWLYHLRPNACRATVTAGSVAWAAPGSGCNADQALTIACLADPERLAALLCIPRVTTPQSHPRRRHGTSHVRGCRLFSSSPWASRRGRPRCARSPAASPMRRLSKESRRPRSAVLGTQIVAQAGNDGRFTLNAPEGAANLMVRAIGYKRQQIQVPRGSGDGERGARARRVQAGRDRDHRPGHRRRAAEPAQRGGDGERRRADPRADRHARERAAGQDPRRHYPGQLRARRAAASRSTCAASPPSTASSSRSTWWTASW